MTVTANWAAYSYAYCMISAHRSRHLTDVLTCFFTENNRKLELIIHFSHSSSFIMFRIPFVSRHLEIYSYVKLFHMTFLIFERFREFLKTQLSKIVGKFLIKRLFNEFWTGKDLKSPTWINKKRVKTGFKILPERKKPLIKNPSTHWKSIRVKRVINAR